MALLLLHLQVRVTDPSPLLCKLRGSSENQPLWEILAISGPLQGSPEHPMKPWLEGKLPGVAWELVLLLPGKKSRNNPSHHGKGKGTACILFKSGVNAERILLTSTGLSEAGCYWGTFHLPPV